MAYPHYRSQFGDTTFTKVFVGGLAWETPTEEMRSYFEQFGEIFEAVIITDKNTGKSKGYGFVTFRDSESARRACVDPNPVIDGRRANCNIASLGRPRPSPPRGRPQQGGSAYQGNAGSYSGVAAPLPQPAAVVYPHYGYSPYTPDYGYHHQAVYNTQVQQAQYYHQQAYGTSSSAGASPYYYGYSFQAPPRPAGPQQMPAGAPSFLYYPTPTNLDPAAASYSIYPPPPPPLQPTRHPFPSSSGSEPQTPPRRATAELEAAGGAATSSETSNT